MSTACIHTDTPLTDKAFAGRPASDLAYWQLLDFARDLERKAYDLRQEIDVLRQYGNKDCTDMADEELRRLRQPY